MPTNDEKMDEYCRDLDESVKKMVDEWDSVKCARCGKIISILDADTIYDGALFICKRGRCKP